MEWADIGDLTLTLFQDGNEQFDEGQPVPEPPATEAPNSDRYTRFLDEKFPNDDFYSFIDPVTGGMSRSSSLQNLQNIGAHTNPGVVLPSAPPQSGLAGYTQEPSGSPMVPSTGHDFSMGPRSEDAGDIKDDFKAQLDSLASDGSCRKAKVGEKTADSGGGVMTDDKGAAVAAKSLSAREQIRREKNRAAVKKCRKRKNERLKELESLTLKLQEENSQLKDEVKRARISKGMGNDDAMPVMPAVATATSNDGSAVSTTAVTVPPGCPKVKTEDGSAVQIPASPPGADKPCKDDADKQKSVFHSLAQPTEATDQQLRMARLGSLMKLYDVKVGGSVDDLDGMLEDVYHPDMVLVSRGQENRGVDGIRNQWKRNKASFPDIRFDSYDIAVQDASAERITIRWAIRGTLVKQVQYGDMVVPPNNIFNKLKDKEVKLAGYTYLTFAEDDHRIIEELQVIKQGYTYNVEQLKLQENAKQ